MSPRAALWAPAATPIGDECTRRFLHPRAATVALACAAVVAVLLAFITHSRPQLAVGVAVLAAITVDAAVAFRAMRSIDLKFAVRSPATTNEPLVCTVRAEGVRQAVRVAPVLRPSVQRFVLDGPTPATVLLAPRRRGVVHSVLVDVVATGPVGLVECGRRFRVRLDRSVDVGPAPMAHDIEWPRPRAHQFGSSVTTPVGDEIYRAVRPYRRGDSRRRVHWKASAHHGRLMIKDSDGTGVVFVRIVLQLDAPGTEAEAACARAAFAVSSALARGWSTELVTSQPRATPTAPGTPLGSPFGPPPVELAPALGPTRLESRTVLSERAALQCLATACYGPVRTDRTRRATLLVSSRGDRWL